MPDTPQPFWSRATRWEWAQAGLLVVILAWTTLANGGHGGRIPVVTVGLIGALVIAHLLSWPRSGAAGRRLHWAGWAMVPFLAYAFCNVLAVTPVRWLGWLDWVGWAQLVAVFWVVVNGISSRGPRRLLFYSLVGLGLVGVLFSSYQRFVAPEWQLVGPGRGQYFLDRASGSFGTPNSYAGFLLLILPVVLALTFRRAAGATERVWWGWVGFVLLFGLVLTLSRGAWLALALALPLVPLVGASGGGRRRAALAAVALVGMLGFGAGVIAKYPLAKERFSRLVADNGEITRPVMWRGAWRLFQDAPLLGTGAGSYNVLFERHRPEGFRDEPLWAHNEYLNTLSDYGVVGFLLSFGAMAGIGLRCALGRSGERRRHHALADPLVLTGMGVGLIAFALQMTVDFHLKIPALAVAAATLAGLAVAGACPAEPRARPPGAAPKVIGGTLAVACAAGVGFVFVPLLEGEGLRAEARRSLDQLWRLKTTDAEFRRTVLQSHGALARATGIGPTNGKAWADLAYVLALRIHFEPARSVELGRTAEDAASRALAITKASGDFWIRRGVARDAQGKWEEAGRDFQEAVKLAPADSMTWYHLAEHLSRVRAVHEAAEAALEFCLRLDPGNHAGLALRQRLAIKNKAP